VARVIAELEKAALWKTQLWSLPALPTRPQTISRAFRGAAMGEWFRDNGMDALFITDDLSNKPWRIARFPSC